MTPPWPHPIIAREGWPYLLAALAVSALAAWWLGWWSAPLWLATVFILQFFRDPPRETPDDPAAVVSPADGRIVECSREAEPDLAVAGTSGGAAGTGAGISAIRAWGACKCPSLGARGRVTLQAESSRRTASGRRAGAVIGIGSKYCYLQIPGKYKLSVSH